MLGKFSAITSSNIFLDPFFRSSPSGTPITQMFMHLMLSLRPRRVSSFLFFCILFYGSDLHHLSRSFVCTSASLFCYGFLLAYYSSLFTYSLVFWVFAKHFLYLLNLCLHSFSKILNYIHYHYPELFFWEAAYLCFI